MKFEEKLKNYLVAKLEKIIEEKKLDFKIKASLNKQYDILFDDLNEISLIMKTGNALKTIVPLYDLTTVPITINITCLANNSEVVLSLLSDLCEEQSKLVSPNLDGYNYRAVYSTPFIVGSPFDIRTKKSTEQAVNIMMLINISYGINALVEIPDIKLVHYQEEIPIEFILRYSMSYTPVYSGYQLEGKSKLDYEKISNNNTYVFTLYKVQEGVSSLQDLLMNEIKGKAYLSDKNLELKIGNDYIPIGQHNVALQYENAISSIVLTLVV